MKFKWCHSNDWLYLIFTRKKYSILSVPMPISLISFRIKTKKKFENIVWKICENVSQQLRKLQEKHKIFNLKTFFSRVRCHRQCKLCVIFIILLRRFFIIKNFYLNLNLIGEVDELITFNKFHWNKYILDTLVCLYVHTWLCENVFFFAVKFSFNFIGRKKNWASYSHSVRKENKNVRQRKKNILRIFYSSSYSQS